VRIELYAWIWVTIGRAVIAVSLMGNMTQAKKKILEAFSLQATIILDKGLL